MGEDRTDRPSPDLDRMTVAEAADALGISQDAIRKRIARGTISHDRDESGRVYVYLSPTETVHKTDQDTASKTVQDAYIRSLEDQIAFLRRELERKDGILLNLTERIPQLEAPSEARESPGSAAEEPEGAEPRPDTPGAQEGVQPSEGRGIKVAAVFGSLATASGAVLVILFFSGWLVFDAPLDMLSSPLGIISSFIVFLVAALLLAWILGIIRRPL